jgi:translation initiation factor 1
MTSDKHKLVYSTESGKISSPRLKKVSVSSFPKDGVVRVSRESKGKKGKEVTLIHGLPMSRNELADLAKQFKQKYGAGGTVKEGIIEIQGDLHNSLVSELEVLGYKVKKSCR